jgi:hypothetical protein
MSQIYIWEYQSLANTIWETTIKNNQITNEVALENLIWIGYIQYNHIIYKQKTMSIIYIVIFRPLYSGFTIILHWEINQIKYNKNNQNIVITILLLILSFIKNIVNI